jgi:hypothetical protein
MNTTSPGCWALLLLGLLDAVTEHTAFRLLDVLRHVRRSGVELLAEWLHLGRAARRHTAKLVSNWRAVERKTTATGCRVCRQEQEKIETTVVREMVTGSTRKKTKTNDGSMLPLRMHLRVPAPSAGMLRFRCLRRRKK